MEIVEEQLADVSEARAYHIDDVLVLQVAGTRPSACHLVTLERAWTDVEPPSFVARMSIDPRARCAPLDQPFDATQAFRIGVHREEVLVRHAGGELTVPVQSLEASAGLAGRRADPPLLIDLPQAEPQEATGYSTSWDLQEAMRDAIAQLPKRTDVTDWLYHYTVVEVGAEVGGIAGFNRLRVTVRG